MNKINSCLLLIGSPKSSRSTSNVLGTYLVSRLAEFGIKNEQFNATKVIRDENSISLFIDAVNRCDLLILSTPLYVDSLPYPVIRVMELIRDNVDKIVLQDKKSLLLVINCGFPEVAQNEIAIKICKRFSGEMGFNFYGALSLSMGGMISGESLDKLGTRGAKIKKSLDLAGFAISNGEEIPVDAYNLISKPPIPRFIYNFLGNLGWKRAAKKRKTINLLKSKPYVEN